MLRMSEKWTCIVVTCPYEHWCQPLQQHLGYLPTDLLLIVPDPSDGITSGASKGVGSGGATLNALLVAVEHLSAREGHTTLVSNVLQTAKILIIHLGPSLLPLPMGLIPLSQNSLRTNVDNVVELCTRFIGCKEAGLFVVGTDIFLKGCAEEILVETPLLPDTDICILTVPASKQYATRHGVCQSVNGEVTNVFYQPDMEMLDSLLNESSDVWILSGLVWLSADVGESLVGLHCMSPLDACTYMGVDSGENTLQISFYYDILTSACTGVSQQDFVEGRCGKTLFRGRSLSPAMKKARKLVWQALQSYSVRELKLEGYETSYLPITGPFNQSELIHQVKAFNSDLKYKDDVVSEYKKETDSVIMFSSYKSLLDKETKFFFFCDTTRANLPEHEQKLLDICKDPVIIAYKCVDEDDICHAVFSSVDALYCHYKDPAATWLGLVWQEALDAISLTAEQVWKDISEAQRNLFNAAVFKLGDRFISLADMKSLCDLSFYFDKARTLRSNVFANQLEFEGQFVSGCKHAEVYKIAAREGWSNRLLEAWDKRAVACLSKYNSSKTTGELAFILAMIGEVLGSMAGGKGGLRSGPASNRDFAHALHLIEKDKYKEGLEELKTVRARWLNQPERMVRAARHYEGAVQSLIRKTVLSAQKQVHINFEERTNIPELEQLIEVRCPARLDLSGGWTDTPPICYELGGKVVDVAIKLNGEKPIGCKAKRVEDMSITIVLSDDIDEVVKIKSLADMTNHNNPNAKGALIKCCLLASGVIKSLDSFESFGDQLLSSLGSGLWLNTWAKLPQGSGLGTSSILASAVMAAIWRCMGVKFTNSDIIHSVLVVEQLLSTGGGWQDQVGGIYPGINVGSSPQDPFVSVDVEHLDTKPEFLQKLESRLLVLYTGKPRLAKNLLQNVIRNWYCKDDLITKAFKDNYATAEKCREAVINEDLKTIGDCLNQYFIIKKILAPGSEPALVKQIFSAISEDILGGTLCGAGGGGFLVALLKDSGSQDKLKERIKNLPGGGHNIEFYTPEIDVEGLVVYD